MKETTWDQQLIQAAVDAFVGETGLPLRDAGNDDAPTAAQRDEFDAVLTLPETGRTLLAGVRKTVTTQTMGAVVQQLRELGPPADTVLVTTHVNRPLAHRLKELDTQFLDTAGNAYLRQPELFVLVIGNRPARDGAEPVPVARPIQAAGLKLVFALLQDPGLINQTYRTMADAADIALGAVGGILKNLTAHGFLAGDDGKRLILEPEKLRNRWVERYPEVLRAKHHLATFTTDDDQWWKQINLQDFGAAWGGEIAAARYTGYLNPRDATVYLPQAHLPDLVKAGRLRKLRKGENPNPLIELYEPFWGDNPEPLAPPLVVYADLLATGDVRNLETAERLHDKYLG
jgi:hypothetical protein